MQEMNILSDSTAPPNLFSVQQKKQILQLPCRRMVSLLVAGITLASPIVVRDQRSLYGGHGLLGAVPHGLLAPGIFSPASALLAASLAAPTVYTPAALPATLPVPVPAPAPAPAVVNPVNEESYDDGSYTDGSYNDGSYNDGSYNDYSVETAAPAVVPTAPVVSPVISGLGSVSPATFPPLDAPGTTPAPALAGPTLDGPTVPPLVIHGPSGTIRSGPLSTGAVSLAGHVPPGHPAVH